MTSHPKANSHSHVLAEAWVERGRVGLPFGQKQTASGKLRELFKFLRLAC
jgi:hypothetical protein